MRYAMRPDDVKKSLTETLFYKKRGSSAAKKKKAKNACLSHCGSFHTSNGSSLYPLIFLRLRYKISGLVQFGQVTPHQFAAMNTVDT